MKASRSRLSLRHALGGLHAGIVGALIMLVFLMAGSILDRRSIWVVPNLFASTFFGSDAYVDRYVHTTWSGLALLMAIYGGLGTIWGCVWRDESRPWLTFYGGVFGLAVYFVFFDFVWKRADPLMTLYAPDRQLELGHIIWGMMLARSPRYARAIAGRVSDTVQFIGQGVDQFTEQPTEQPALIQDAGEAVK
ncbi:MAG TPA: hypothetical protein VG273_04410 [Bryobacteraceae bacterium]|nr:hypothetical protein [Bryobacteraceae bacterium]